ncbi:MAG: SLBB domain-containing protein [Spirochaetales bacterium]|uniref:SLBB domain-containing protein n=1 Tax=Candidatus Thalassospirochaeta sargassi TaxID=3119039 RepID=A0AAJ1IAG8_9SPIO|nr:SLBB domain-containing protein [Spirochaetales bacterium]
MKKIFIIGLSMLMIITPVFAVTDGAGSEGDAGFGLQASIFRYVLTSSNDMLNTATGVPTNFEELNNYPLTPGDIFTLLINYGANSERSADYITNYNIQLLPDYTMVFPFIGKTDVRDMNITELQTFISDRISKMMPVQYVSFNLTTPANFNVFIYGGVNTSGYINATPVTTVIDAIAMCKGFKSNASYRDVKILRGDEVISVDISRFYQNADFDSNPRLKPGDKLYIPTAETVVTVTGMIQFPGAYELLPGETLETLLKLAGGPKSGAQAERIEIARIDNMGKTVRLEVPASEAASTVMQNGDTVSIPSISDNAETITVEGAIYGQIVKGTAPFKAPTTSVKLEVPYYPGISLLNVLDQVGGPTPYAIMDRAQIRRPDNGEFISLDIEQLWKTRNIDSDVELEPGDHILIPIEKTFVGIFGAVNATDSDTYYQSHVNGYTVMDYIVAAGGIDYETANPNNIELIDREGNRIDVELTDEVPPGSIIYVNENILQQADNGFDNVILVTAWLTAIVSAVSAVTSIIEMFQTD